MERKPGNKAGYHALPLDRAAGHHRLLQAYPSQSAAIFGQRIDAGIIVAFEAGKALALIAGGEVKGRLFEVEIALGIAAARDASLVLDR